MTTSVPTRAALLTSLAPGAIAVVRLAGPEAVACASRILRRRQGDRLPELIADRPVLCRLVENDFTVDDALVVRRAPDMVEISTHGGPRVAQRVLELLAKASAAIVSAKAFECVWAEDAIQRDVDQA